MQQASKADIASIFKYEGAVRRIRVPGVRDGSALFKVVKHPAGTAS